MTTAEFEAHLKTAPCGAWITYHLGHLWWDRDKDRELAALGDSVFKAYQSKAALLVQRRLGPGRFEYIAVKRSPPTTRKKQRISGLLWPFLAYPKKDRLMYDRQDLIWDGSPATVEPDSTWPRMWRVRVPDGYLTDMVNLSRAKDAAASLALGVLNRHLEAA